MLLLLKVRLWRNSESAVVLSAYMFFFMYLSVIYWSMMIFPISNLHTHSTSSIRILKWINGEHQNQTKPTPRNVKYTRVAWCVRREYGRENPPRASWASIQSTTCCALSALCVCTFVYANLFKRKHTHIHTHTDLSHREETRRNIQVWCTQSVS